MNRYRYLFEMCRHGDWKRAGNDTDYRFKTVGGVFYLIFACSDQVQDWRYNFNAWWTLNAEGARAVRVHSGFQEAWSLARSEILDLLAPIIESGMPIVILGYSHGGALAQLCHNALHGKAECVLFASPRVFKDDPSLDRLTLVVNRGDPVPSVPLLIMGYRDAGKRVVVGRSSLPSFKKHEPGEYAKSLDQEGAIT